jgi:hypothetical protein
MKKSDIFEKTVACTVVTVFLISALIPAVSSQEKSLLVNSKLSENINALIEMNSDFFDRAEYKEFLDTLEKKPDNPIPLNLSDSWWNSNWQHRKEISINHSKVTGILTNFPVLVNITDSDLRDDALENGYDIAFVNKNGDKLAHEIEMFNGTSGKLVCWVNVTTLSNTMNTTLYMYYGNPSATNQQNPAGVWKNHYAMVQHLEEISGIITDSTSFKNNGTEYISPDSNMNVTGKIDGAIYFDGTDDYVTFGQPSSLNFRPNIDVFTISFWEKTTDTAGAFFTKADTSSRQINFYTVTADGLAGQVGQTQITTHKTVDNGIWHHIVGVNYDDAGTKRFRFYVDGTADATIITSGSTTNSRDVLIGARRASSNTDYASNLVGLLDEVRVSNIARNGTWISTEYNNQVNPSLFISLGEEETYQPPHEPIVSNESPDDYSVGIPIGTVILSISVNDFQGDDMNVYFRTNASGSWSDIDSNLTVPNGTYSQEYIFNDFNRMYWWSVNCSDDTGHWTNQTYCFTTEMGATPWWNTNWPYRKEITLNHSKVTGYLLNFPVLINILDSDLRDDAQNTGDDIVFTDQSNQKLNHEIEMFNDTSGKLVCWVNVTSLSSTEDTILYIYYGNPSCGNQENPQGVWDSGYVMVQHLDETSGTVYDSTSNNYDGTPYNGVLQNTEGKIAGADKFDRTDDYIETVNGINNNRGTISLWVKLNWGTYAGGATDDYGLVSYWDTQAGNVPGDSYYIDNGRGLRIYPDAGGSNSYTLSWSAGDWHYITVTYDTTTTNQKHYEDGVQVLSDSYTTPPVLTSMLWIGSGKRGTEIKSINGTIDEVRISTLPRNNSWISTEYNNQQTPSTFYVIGIEEPPGAPRVSNPNPTYNANNIPVTLTELNFTLIDYENDPMNYTVTTNPDIIGGTKTGNSIANGTTVHIPITSGPLSYGSTYQWIVNVTDGTHWAKITYQFTTISQAPQITNIIPADGSINIPLTLAELSFTLVDYQNDKMNYTIRTIPDIIGGIKTGNNITNSTTIHVPKTTPLTSGTTYQWRVNCTDGKEWTNHSYTFTTKSSPDFPLKWTINTGGANYRGTRIADINGDGAKEILFHSCPFSGPASILFIKAFNGTDGSEIWRYYDTNITYTSGAGRIEVTDLNNDDIPEVVFATTQYSLPGSQNRGGMIALHGNNGSIYWKIWGLEGPSHANNPVIFDQDLDGYPTIFTATRSYEGSSDPAIYSLTYDGQINCHNNLNNLVCAGGLALMDYNNDGHFEVYAGDWYEPGEDPSHPAAYGVVRAYYAENLTNIWSSSLVGNPDYILGPAAMVPILADANGDGIKEVITQIYENVGHARVGFAVLSAEDGEILDLHILRGSAGVQEPAVYDIDNDGHNELIMVGHEGSPRSFTVFDLVTETIDFQTGVNSGSWMHPIVADVTGDGTKEILVPDSNRILIYNKTYSMIKQLNLIVGGEYTDVYVDDVDGDGLVEIVVSATTHLQVFDTEAPVPTGGIRSELCRYSEYRNGVAEYVSILGLKEEYPPRNTIGTSLNPILSVNVTDYQFKQMDITFRTNASGSWQDIIGYDNVSNGVYTATTSVMNINGKTYYWSVNATDRINTWTNMTYKFTTITEHPILSSVYPGNNETGTMVNPTLSAFIKDQQGDELSVSFMTNESGSWQQIGSTQTGYNNTYTQTTTMFNTFNKKYWWSINCSDETDNWTNETFVFTTKTNNPPTIFNITPSNSATNVPPSITQLSFNISDADGHTMTYTVNTIPDIGSGTSSGSVSNGRYSVSVSGLTYNTSYIWYVNVSDGFDWTNESFSFTTRSAPAAWWNTSWLYRKEIVIHHEKVAGDLINFPVLITQIDDDLAAHAQNSGGDIVFTDNNGNTLNHEIESFNSTSGKLVCWLNVTSLSSSIDTFLYMYYGNSACSNQENPTGVWDSKYMLVQHLEETSGTITDSTIHSNNGTEYITPDSNMDVNGTINGAIDFDGTDDHITFGQPSNLNFQPNVDEFTISLWLKTTDASGGIIGKAGGTTTARQYYIYTESGTAELSAWIGGSQINTGHNIDDDQWHFIVGVNYDNASTKQFRFYIDGVADSHILTSGSATNTLDLLVAARRGSSNSDYASNLDGVIDEVRISNIARSAEWIITKYYNQNNPSGFYSVGSEELTPSENAWDVLLTFTGPNTEKDSVLFGEASTAFDGLDDLDVPKPGSPPAPYIYAWFDANLSEPYNKLWEDYRAYPDVNKTWDLNVRWENSGPDTVTIQWNPDNLTCSEYNSVILRDVDLAIDTDMLTIGQYSYLAADNVVHHFKVIASMMPSEVTYTVSLGEEWNFVSFPVNESVGKSDITVRYLGVNYSWQDAVTGGIIINIIYGWSTTLKNYDMSDVFNPGFGYWVYAYETCNLSITIAAINDDTYISSLQQEWNLIGLPFTTPVNKQDLIVVYDGSEYSWQNAISAGYVMNSVYGWSPSVKNYVISDVLDPGTAYWMYAYANCILKKGGSLV